MKVLILGAGVIGVTTAYRLLKDGHEVEATSAGNAGLIAPGHSHAWASPGAPGILLKSLFKKHQALRFKFRADPRLYT